MKKKWNLLFLFAFIVSMIILAGCGKTAGEASPYEGTVSYTHLTLPTIA